MICPRKIGPYGEVDLVIHEESEAAMKKLFTSEQIKGALARAPS
jgi:hypothetical protein